MGALLLLLAVLALANAVRAEHASASWRVFLLRAGSYGAGSALLVGLGMALGGDIRLLLIAAAVAVVCCAVIETDSRWLVIPDVASLVLIACAGLLGSDHWQVAIWGTVLCGGLFLLVKLAFQFLRSVDGLGWGDVKFAAALGALLGPVPGMGAIAAATIATSMLLLHPAVRSAASVEIAGRPAAPLGVGLAASGLAAFVVQQSGMLS